jgi:hypothetical protein
VPTIVNKVKIKIINCLQPSYITKINIISKIRFNGAIYLSNRFLYSKYQSQI